MRNIISAFAALLLVMSLAGKSYSGEAVQLSDHVWLITGPVNGVAVEKDNARFVVYGDPDGTITQAEMVLFTHSRRDVVWAGRKLVEQGATAIMPEADAENFTNVEQFWNEFTTRRFHDYAQQGTKILTKSFKAVQTVREGQALIYRHIPIKVLDTPGYMRHAVSYFIEIDGVKYGFVGDIIYGNGKLFDLYSLQDAVPEAKIGGYHGWAGRMPELIESLQKVADQDCDILIPARGPVIRNPAEAIDLLIKRLRAVYENYLSISAGRWYFKDSYDVLARRVLGDDPKVNWMPWAEVIQDKPPEWIIPIDNSRLIVSKDRTGFLIDCGSRRIVEEIVKLREAGKVTGLDGLFITHYHDDHTNDVAACLAEFNCPVYATGPSIDILKDPGKYRLPCLTPNPIADITAVPEAHKMRWKEFTFTFHDFPGQTIYHDALLVEKDGADPARDGQAQKIFFIGDSFTPSGIDDYCLLNRNLLHEHIGYLYCLALVRRMSAGTLLINEHVVQPFAFSAAQLDLMTAALTERRALLSELFPWDEPNYGIDEGWIRFFPYAVKAKPGQTVKVSLKAFNHSDGPRRFTVTLNVPPGFGTKPGRPAGAGRPTRALASTLIPPRTESALGTLDFDVLVDASIRPGIYVFTADVELNEYKLVQWTEGIIEVE
ncbi:MAG TPA: MBL fold metallo-hydrolase [Sedimentisphaerales bacterium]|nr:MBL fold metallo-hydrolase [Sedimentisphaerales bacterium]